MDIVDLGGTDNTVYKCSAHIDVSLLLQQNQYVRRENGKVWFYFVPVSRTPPKFEGIGVHCLTCT